MRSESAILGSGDGVGSGGRSPPMPRASAGGRFGRLTALFLAGLAIATPAAAHGFGQRFDLPLPLAFWVTGAGASIVLSFVVMAIFVKERAVGEELVPVFETAS